MLNSLNPKGTKKNTVLQFILYECFAILFNGDWKFCQSSWKWAWTTGWLSPAISASAGGLPRAFPTCFCFAGPAVPGCPFPNPFWTVALEELWTLWGEEGGLFVLLFVCPVACLSFNLFFKCSCILRVLSSRWTKFVLPWERDSKAPRKTAH